MRHPAISNTSKPADLPQRARGAADGVLDRVSMQQMIDSQSGVTGRKPASAA
jgi:hypothetical protein